MLNSVTLAGRLTKDPELRYTKSQKPVASFTVACERDFAPTGEEKETDFVDIVAWNKTAEFVHQYFTKGSMVIVTGRLQSREWTDKNDNKRVSWEVVADRVYFGESKKKDAVSVEYEPTYTASSAFTELADSDGELPF